MDAIRRKTLELHARVLREHSRYVAVTEAITQELEMGKRARRKAWLLRVSLKAQRERSKSEQV